jgi:GR25 family glycosyltransferase involved in LPS biosynthesis
MKVIIYYINLESRVDKNKHAVNLLSAQTIPYIRIPATSYADVASSAGDYLYKKITTAVKTSHIRACEAFLASDYEFALILEDDFSFNVNIFRTSIERHIDLMTRRKINYLQLGYLGFGDARLKISKLKKFLFSLFELSYSVSSLFRNPFSPVVFNSIRWGAQAYLVDRLGATVVVKTVDKLNKDPIDLVYRKMARIKPSTSGSMRMARLKKNMIKQNLYFKSDSQNIF